MLGANGFIGSHLVDSLSNAGHDVTAFDRFRSGNVAFEATNIRRVVGDFLSIGDLKEVVRDQDYVFHFLSLTNPAMSEDDPTLDVRTNVSQSIELFRLCAEASVRRIFFASTGGAIYGDQGQSVYSETDQALPVSPYGIGKLTLERYLHYFRTKHGLESVSLRISNPYGTRQHRERKQGLIPIVLRQIAANEPVVRFGTGTMIRDFIYVDDVARMIAAMTTKPLNFDVYNIGSGVGFSVGEVLDIIRQVTQKSYSIREAPVPSTYLNEVVLDTGRYSAEFGAEPLTPLAEGIAKTWEHERVPAASH